MFGVIWPFTCHRDLTAQSSCFRGIFVILDFFLGYFSRLELCGYFGQLRDFGGIFSSDILWFWGYFGDFRSIKAILVISKVFFVKKIILPVKISKILKNR